MATENPTMDKELQKLYLQMQMLEQQSQQLQKQIQAIDQQVGELESIKAGLEQLQAVKPGTEIFVQFAGGIFIKAELKDNKDLLLNVGASTAVTKSTEGTIGTISAQVMEMAELRQKMVEQLDRVIEKARDLEQEMEKLV